MLQVCFRVYDAFLRTINSFSTVLRTVKNTLKVSHCKLKTTTAQTPKK